MGLFNGDPVGSPATLICELGQVRKEAAAADVVCAGMWLAGPPPIYRPAAHFLILTYEFPD